ncbi:MAG: CvpA family protein [Oscillospiraceae bacterium]
MGIDTGIIIDLLLIGVLLIFAFIYAKKGFVAGIVEFIGSFCSVIGAFLLSQKLSTTLFESFFEKSITDKMALTIQNNQGVMTVEEIINKITGLLPKNIVDAFLGGKELAVFDFSAPDLAQQLVEQIVKPLLLPIISIVIFFAAFAIFKLVLTFITSALTNINKIPLVGGFNRFAGFFSGVLVGLLNVFILINVMWAVVMITADDLSFLNSAILQQSRFYTMFSRFIPFN